MTGRELPGAGLPGAETTARERAATDLPGTEPAVRELPGAELPGTESVGTGDALTVPVPFEYAVLRVVPRVERGERINAGVVLYCQAAAFLGCVVHLDPDRLRALDPGADQASIMAALEGVQAVCDGDAGQRAGAGQGAGAGREASVEREACVGLRAGTGPRIGAVPAAGEALRVRFGWLTAPRSTVLRTGRVHVGLTRDPAQEVRRLADRLVR